MDGYRRRGENSVKARGRVFAGKGRGGGKDELGFEGSLLGETRKVCASRWFYWWFFFLAFELLGRGKGVYSDRLAATPDGGDVFVR